MLTLQESPINAETDESVIATLQTYLHQHRTSEALTAVLDVLDKKGIKNTLQKAWQVLRAFSSPGPQENFLSIWMATCAADAKVPDQGIDDAIKELERLIKSKVTEEWAYLHVAQYYFTRQKASKARNVLRKCIENATSSRTTKLFYCQNLAFSAQNKRTIEGYLLPLLAERQDDETAPLAANFLQNYYLEINDFESAFRHQQKYKQVLDESILSIRLSLYSLQQNDRFVDPTDALVVWRNKTEQSAKESFPAHLLEEPDDILAYYPQVLLTRLLELWKNSPTKADFTVSLLALDDTLEDNSIGEVPYFYAERSHLNVLLGLANEDALAADRDFWLLVIFYVIEERTYLPTELREEVPRLYSLYPTKRMKYFYLIYETWFSKLKTNKGCYISLLYDVVLNENRGDTTDLYEEHLYSAILSKDSAQGGSMRPLPYLVDAFINGFENNQYPHSFLEGVWSHVIRSVVVRENAHQNDKLMKLVSIFDKLMPDTDPLFVKGWNLLSAKNYLQAMKIFQHVLENGGPSYSVYRNLSYCASNIGNHQLAYEYELKAHNDPNITVPENRFGLIDSLYEKVKEIEANARHVTNVSAFYIPDESAKLVINNLSLVETIELIALIKEFSIPGTTQCRALCASSIHWLPSAESSTSLGVQMVSNKTAYFTNPVQGEGLKQTGEGSFSVDFDQLAIAPNLDPIGEWQQQLNQLYARLEQLQRDLSIVEMKKQLLPIVVLDLECYAMERFGAYGISTEFKAKYKETAEHCLDLHRLTVCYGIFYHEIEDAAAKQREAKMSDQHTVNYGLKCARNKATRAHENQWKLSGYERGTHASAQCAVVKVICELGLF